jgi:Flp pilus assembly protein TadG
MKSLFKFLLRLARCSSGSALVEMAIIVPVTIALMIGGVDFGWWVSTQATGSKSVRDAARYLGSLPASDCNAATANAKNLAVYGSFTAGTPLIPNWQPSDVTVTCPLTQSSVTVFATFPYKSIIVTSAMALYFPALPSTFTLSTQHVEPQVGGA